MEELCQPTMNGRGGPIAPVNIQATDFGLKNHIIQQVQNSCQFHGLPGDDANKHLDKLLTITQIGPSFPPPSLSSSSKEVERELKPTMEQVLLESTIRVPPPVVYPSPTPRSSEIPLPPTSFLLSFLSGIHISLPFLISRG
ncbi:hypothetical protein Tco_1114887 [Tanacetum coccineum]